jgi:transcriptional regulator with XRE-family HTH domain
MAHGQLDVSALYSALDAERRARDISWRQLAKEVGVSPSTLTRLANGHRPDVDAFAALVHWLGVPAERFFASDRPSAPEPDLLTQLAPLLRARRDLTEADVSYLEEIIAAAVRRFRSERPDGTDA